MTDRRQPYMPLLDVAGDPFMSRIFSEDAALDRWLEVERELAAAQADLGIIPLSAAQGIAAAAVPVNVDASALRSGIRTVGYPILPLINQIVAESPSEVGNWLHFGATTQDIMDTAAVLQLRSALDRIEDLLSALGSELVSMARAHQSTIMAGRTHAQYAVPTTFGAKVAIWLAEFTRHRHRLDELRSRLEVVSLFGAAGTSAAMGPRSAEVRQRLAARLGLSYVEVPWHTARDSIAEAGFVVAAIASSCGKIGREVIELSRPEISELRESFEYHRGASSTMPQKANPIASEVTLAMSVVAAHHVPALLAAMQATHERAAGEWQIEWDAVPLLFGTAAGALVNAVELVTGLTILPERMRSNLALDGGMIMAEAVMMEIAAVVGRARAHEVVYQACVLSREGSRSFGDVLKQSLDAETSAQLPAMDALLDPDRYLGEAQAAVASATAQWEREFLSPSHRSSGQPAG